MEESGSAWLGFPSAEAELYGMITAYNKRLGFLLVLLNQVQQKGNLARLH